MGLTKILLKAIIIPVVVVLLMGVLVWFLIKRHRDRKREEKAIEGQQFQQFQPPPITQWATGPHPASPVSAMHKPEPVFYPVQQPVDPRGQV
ncbi:hypothetical protein P170DRAFT_433420 [Aspergillus steynii IBT 23096]|uniref:Uncharacterized protein n=1 Tax=Aspergillus steynii IBT 23096 TaxID=1392250 RepID=A0A2I2GEV0_9EURO|nr:uncharacterized protein P170DRAFT_433420 [Aspergillus steynii IBT 23096]PLB51413.1 hypothetical protein P170DRAFT_433420 [Aspergillus steynii IBT 23096]